jgi:hypothetical protein
MRFKLYREFGALNSKDVFDALSKGILRCGWKEIGHNEDISVIWSVLWNGRMLPNQNIYHKNLTEGRKTLILEVGSLKRGTTWKLALNNVNRNGKFGNEKDLDNKRPAKLGVSLQNVKANRDAKILIACQHEKSLQWPAQTNIHEWVNRTITDIRQYSDREIVVRPHPRCPLRGSIVGASLELPKKLPNTYDDFNIDYNYHCVFNYNSGPAVQAAIYGTPVVCDITSLAYPVSIPIQRIEEAALPDREKWFLDLCHTEWTLEEIASGEPLQKLLG